MTWRRFPLIFVYTRKFHFGRRNGAQAAWRRGNWRSSTEAQASARGNGPHAAAAQEPLVLALRPPRRLGGASVRQRPDDGRRRSRDAGAVRDAVAVHRGMRTIAGPGASVLE